MAFYVLSCEFCVLRRFSTDRVDFLSFCLSPLSFKYIKVVVFRLLLALFLALSLGPLNFEHYFDGITFLKLLISFFILYECTNIATVVRDYIPHVENM